MTQETMLQCLEVIKKTGAHTLDLTGGAPEMNPNFRWFVDEASKVGIKDFIVRSNLTIIKANKKNKLYENSNGRKRLKKEEADIRSFWI